VNEPLTGPVQSAGYVLAARMTDELVTDVPVPRCPAIHCAARSRALSGFATRALAAPAGTATSAAHTALAASTVT
jgi:hypothetical protein